MNKLSLRRSHRDHVRASPRELVDYYHYDTNTQLQLLNENRELDHVFEKIKQAAASRQILDLNGKLEILAQAEKAPRAKPRVNISWNNNTRTRTTHEGMS